jgi:hypothetical protein
MESEGLTVQHSMAGLPPPARNFQSPARGGDWQPDYSKYAAALGRQVRAAVEKGIYE